MYVHHVKKEKNEDKNRKKEKKKSNEKSFKVHNLHSEIYLRLHDCDF